MNELRDESPLALSRPDLMRGQNFINGTWCDAVKGGWHEVSDPATDTVFSRVPDSTAEDGKAAANAAARAFTSWRNVSARDRSRLLKRWHQLILDNSEDLARLMSREQGKPLAEARGEATFGAAYVEWFAEQAVRSNGDMLVPGMPGRQQMVVREPVGVVAAVTPWNFPLAMIARKIAPALAAGCTVVAKPAEDTPLTALALVALAEEAGFPAGVINIVTASRPGTPDTVGSWLNDPRVRKLTFTGSTPVGKYLARASSDTLKRLSLELGGNAPFIVFEDADIPAAVDGLMRGKFRNSGQTCVSPNRVYVHDAVYAEFVEQLKVAVEALTIGPAEREDSLVGPMINGRAIEKIERHVRDALDQGATLITGGHSVRNEIADGPFYYAPTILGDAKESMTLHCEETFGPLVPLFRFTDEADVINRANDTSYGLAAYFYSQDPARIWRVSGQLEAGVIGINEGVFASEVAPFGGIKESGYGREGSHYGLDDYLQFKYLCQGNLA
ncbi:NAD-dependent succinate-semialdehyde dehydrogenase [Parahaliea maris]|uniref:NAD-dependent succinate-semialdehyde dehydrogenase n=2 Tax=Parahaliea maris TaxID=2716870 RepID=A0A5C8ZN36_9GAMM|nr:NAD-dependent succinate-semialdehyde dehydrogenase [Parahaliea maris]